jgi:hypothetical protein
MFIHQIIVYTGGGVCVAQYPKKPRIDHTSSFFTALRQFSIANKYGDVQGVQWMNQNASFVHSRQRDLSFSVITGSEDDVQIAVRFISHVRDAFVEQFPESISIDFRDTDYDALLKSIVDAAITSFNAISRDDVIYI